AVGRSKDYRADSGFTRRVNNNSFFFANRISTKSNAKSKLIRFDWRQSARYQFDWNGRVTDGAGSTSVNLALQGNIFINAETGVAYEQIYEDDFGARRNANQLGGFSGSNTRKAYQPYFSFNINKP